MPGFWDAFWPIFLATIPGTFVGVGGAFGIGYLVRRTTERRHRGEQHVQLVTAIRALRRALVDNSNVFKTLSESLDQGTTPEDTHLDGAIWGAVRPQISSQIHDYQLLGDISAYYASVDVIGRLYDRFLDLTMGTAASLPQAPVHRGNLRTFLSHRMTELKADADRILNQLDAKDAALFQSSG